MKNLEKVSTMHIEFLINKKSESETTEINNRLIPLQLSVGAIILHGTLTAVLINICLGHSKNPLVSVTLICFIYYCMKHYGLKFQKKVTNLIDTPLEKWNSEIEKCKEYLKHDYVTGDEYKKIEQHINSLNGPSSGFRVNKDKFIYSKKGTYLFVLLTSIVTTLFIYFNQNEFILYYTLYPILFLLVTYRLWIGFIIYQKFRIF